MATTLTCLRVFIASPGGLGEERKAFRAEIQEYNDSEAIPRGVLFRAVGWEDTLGGIGRPQSIINEDIRTCDLFVLVLADRWGSPPDVRPDARFTSGTEEEYHVAMECCGSDDHPMRQLLLFFKAVDPGKLSDPGPQLQKVLDFKKQIEQEKSHLYHSFDSPRRFRELLRKHLAAWLRHQEAAAKGEHAEGPAIDPAVPIESIEDPGVTEALEPPPEGDADTSLTRRAWALADEGRLTEAEVVFARAIVGSPDPDALLSYAGFLNRLGRLDQAMVMIERAIEMAQEQGDEEALANAYGNLGIVLRVRGDLDGAEEMHRKSLEIEEKLGRLEGMASQYGNLGIVLAMRGDLDGAEEMYRKALEIDEKLGRLEGMASQYGNLGIALRVRGDLDGAEEMYHKSLEINEKLGRLEGMASDYGNLGNVLRVRGDLDEAEVMYRIALEIEEKLGRLEGMASQYGNLGNVLATRGDLDGAEEMYRKALEIDEKLGRLEGMASQYGNLGIVLRVRGDLDGAEEMHRKSLEIEEKLGRLEGMASDYGNLGIVLAMRGDLNGAEEMYRKALEAAERLGSPPQIAWAKSLLAALRELRSDESGADTTEEAPD